MSILTKDGKVLLRNNKPVEYNPNAGKIPLVGASGTEYPPLPNDGATFFAIYIKNEVTYLYTSTTILGGKDGEPYLYAWGASSANPVNVYTLTNNAWVLYHTYTYETATNQLVSSYEADLANYAVVFLSRNDYQYKPTYLIDYFPHVSE